MTISYSGDPGALEVDLEFEAIMAPNPHPDGVVPFLKGAHFDQAGHVTGTMVLHGEELAVDCYWVRDRSWGPRPLGRPQPPAGHRGVRTRAGGPGPCGRHGVLVLCRRPGRSLADLTPCRDPRRSRCRAASSCGAVSTGTSWPASGGSRFDPETGWPVTMEIAAEGGPAGCSRCAGEVVRRH